MSKKFIDKVALKSKELVSLTLEKKEDRPKKKSVVLQIKIHAEDNDEKSFSKGEVIAFLLEMNVQMYSRDPREGEDAEQEIEEREERQEDLCFQCDAEIEVKLQFQEDSKYKETLLPQFAEEIVSLAYDDFRIIIEDSINRTSFRGFYLPDDFRDIASKENVIAHEK